MTFAGIVINRGCRWLLRENRGQNLCFEKRVCMICRSVQGDPAQGDAVAR